MSSDDLEKKSIASENAPSTEEVGLDSGVAQSTWYGKVTQVLKTYGVETHGYVHFVLAIIVICECMLIRTETKFAGCS